MTDIVYTDQNWVEQGFVQRYWLDLAYGNDENDFELVVPIDFAIERDSLVYVDGTGWGGIVRSNNPSTTGSEPLNAIKGSTWQGILAESFLVPDDGESHVSVSGDANAAMRSVLSRQGLDRMFSVDPDPSGFSVSYSFDRFTDVYSGFRKMLSRSGAKLVIGKNPGGKPTLSAVGIVSYIDEESSGRFAYEIADDVPFNHLIAVGKGEMEERDVVHLYADADGNVSETQTIFFPRERQYLYELSNADHDDLVQQAREKLDELQNVRTCELRLPDGESFEVGDIVGVVDEEAGVSIASDVTKVIVRTGVDGELEVSNEIGEITRASSSASGTSYTSGGIAYSAGKGITISGAKISAEVDRSDLESKADAVHAHTWGEISGKPSSYPPSSHGHAEASVSEAGFLSAGDKKKIDAYPWDAISGKPATFAPSAHGHSAADVTVGTLPLARGGTGGSSAQAACDSLMAASMGAKRVVPANADLNAYKTPGSYTCNADANAKTLANCPTGGISFHMIVDQVLGHGTYLSQTIRQYNANIVWMRVSTNAGASWGAWQRTWAIAPDAAAARASIGAAASSHGHGAMTGASASAAGAAGFVPAPAAGAATRYLRSDGTWQVPPDTNTVYTHPTGAGSKHVPAGGSSGQILRWGADGTAVWGADNNTTYAVATQSANGLMSAADKKKLDGISAGANSLTWQQVYPVGALYISYASTSPASLFGGTWTAITGRFPYFNAGTGTGGSNTHTLTGTQMPSHYHGVVREQDGDWAGYWQSNASGGGLWWIVSNGTPGANRGLKTTSVGGGGSHNNMPAYQTLYAWRRTA